MDNIEQVLYTLPNTAVYKDDFIDTQLSADWNLTLDAQHTSDIGNSYLRIVADTTTGASELVSSAQSFEIPLRIGFLLSVNQRIANQEISFGIKDATGQDSVNVIFDGTNPNKAKVSCSYGGFYSTNNDLTIPNSVDFNSPVLVEIDCFHTEVRFYFRSLDKRVTKSGDVWGYALQRNTPSLALDYQLYLKIENKAATASNTEVRLDKVYVAEYSQGANGGGGSSALTDAELRASPIAVSSTTLLTAGTAPTGITGPATGTGTYRWLGAIWQLFTDFLTKIPAALVSGRFDINLGSQSQPVLSTTYSSKWREDFSGTQLNSSEWTISQTGAGQSVSVSGSDLVILAGVTSGAETIIRSTREFSVPVRLLAIVNFSQRIANQEFYIELVDSQTNTNLAQLLFDSNVTNQAKVGATNNGNSTGFLTNTIANTTTGYATVELDITSDELAFCGRSLGVTNGRYPGTYINRQIPDPNLKYFIRIRAKNTGLPASSTTFRIDALVIEDIEELTAEIVGGRGGGGISQAVPVFFPSVPAVTINSGNVTAAINATSGGAINITNTPLSADSTYTSAYSSGSPAYREYNGVVVCDVPGILYFEQSSDLATWYATDVFECVSGMNCFEFKPYANYVRYRYVNGSSPQTTFRLYSNACFI